MKQLLNDYLTAAEHDGRTLTDAEAELIESLASVTESPAIDVEAREAIASLRNEVTAQLDARPTTVASSVLPNREGMDSLLNAIRTKQPLNVEAAYYVTHKPVETVTTPPRRLVESLMILGASEGPIARKMEVPRIASGDADVWTPGDPKAEIVTELAAIDASVVAAYTELTSVNMLDIFSLQMQIENLLARRVIVQENLAIASALELQGTSGTGGSSEVETVVDSMVTATGSGTGANVLLLSSDIARGVLSAAQAGMSGLEDYWRGTLFGMRFHIVPGLTAGTSIAADAASLVIGRTPMQILVDPYSGSTSNAVILRAETSVAIAAVDPTAVGVSVLAN